MKNNLIKLTNAVYSLLEYFPESDPLKNRVKDKALSVMENFLEAAQRGEPRPIGRDIDILLGYLEIAKLQGWLNSANYFIVANEYKKLRISPVISAKAEIQIESNNKLTARQSKILEFLEDNQKAQVMDLMKVLPKVTKRTIRRDLDELLKMGQIERVGTFNQVIYKIKMSH